MSPRTPLLLLACAAAGCGRSGDFERLLSARITAEQACSAGAGACGSALLLTDVTLHDADMEPVARRRWPWEPLPPVPASRERIGRELAHALLGDLEACRVATNGAPGRPG